MLKNKWNMNWAFCIVTLIVAIVVIPVFSWGTLTNQKTEFQRFHEQVVPKTGGPNILLITIDTLRADHVGLYGYERATTPQIDKYFQDAMVFDVAYAPTPSTTPSILSMFSGMYPQNHGVRLFCQKISPDVLIVTDYLKRAGYQTGAVVSNAVLADRACGLGGRFDDYDDHVDEKEPFRDDMFERNAARTTDAALQWLNVKRKKGSPHMLWVHYIDPHGPYRPPADKPVDFTHATPKKIDLNRLPYFAREPGMTDGYEYVDRYDEEIAYTDREVGRLLEGYESLGLLEDALVIFTADHGESMMEHDYWFWHQMNVYEETIRIPLAIRSKHLSAKRVKEAVSLIDIAPTLLSAASLPIPAQMQGQSLFEPIASRYLLVEGRADGGGLWRGLIRDGVKVIARHGLSNIIREMKAYDLTHDPLELKALAMDDRDPRIQILTQVIASDPHSGGIPKEFVAGELPAPDVAPDLDPHMYKQLRSLGYVGE